MRKTVHPIFNNRTLPIFEIFGVLLFLAAGGVVENIWRKSFTGTVYGKCLAKDSDTSLRSKRIKYVNSSPYEKYLLSPVGNIKISWDAGSHGGMGSSIFTNYAGEYLFYREVPVGHNLFLVAIFENNRRITKSVPEIENVIWFLGLPMSSGSPKRVDFEIPSNPIVVSGD